MEKQETAKDIIRTYFPAELAKRMDLDTLAVSKDSFLDEENNESESDILYEIELEGRKVYLYLLFEHKSYNDKYVALQLYKYMYNIWKLDIEQKKTEATGELQLILPFVFYQGSGDWQAGNTLSKILQPIPNTMKPFIPDFKYLMLNLKTQPFDALKGELDTQIMLKTMKIVFMEGVAVREKFTEILHLIKLRKQMAYTEESLELFRLCILYILRTAKDMTQEDVSHTVNTEIPEWREEFMSIADTIEEKGVKKGIKRMIINLYESGMAIQKIAEMAEISEEEVKEIISTHRK